MSYQAFQQTVLESMRYTFNHLGVYALFVDTRFRSMQCLSKGVSLVMHDSLSVQYI